MIVIISPAKKMESSNIVDYKTTPILIEKTKIILNTLQSLTKEELKKLWNCNDDILELNYKRITNMNLHTNLSPAIFSYIGIQFQEMSCSVFDYEDIEYIQNHLRIISGFYGILKPLDGIREYRLEFQTKLKIGKYDNLYDFWDKDIANELKDDIIINLASKEYSKAIKKHIQKNQKFINFYFGEILNNKFVEKGIFCKMARGAMVKYLTKNKIDNLEEIKKFNYLNFEFAKDISDENNYYFTRRVLC